MGAPLRRREVVRDVEVWVRDQVGEGDEDDGAGCAGDEHLARELRPAAQQPRHQTDEDSPAGPVGEREAHHPADRHLPCGDDPRPEEPPGPSQSDAPDRERDRKGDAAGRDDLQVAVLLQPVGGVGERGPGDHGADRAEAELAGEHVCAEEGERVGEEEEQVVPDHGGVRPAADDSRRGVADQRIAEGKRVLDRPEAVGVEEVQRLMEQRVSTPGRLPGLRQWIADVTGDGAAQVQDQRPASSRSRAGQRPLRRSRPHGPSSPWRA